MDIGRIMIGVVDQLNKKHCNLCWKLVLGGRSDYFNNERTSVDECDCSDCCVRVGVLDVGWNDIYKESEFFRQRISRDWTIELFFGIPSRLDLQFFNEVIPDDFENSKWCKYISPIACCLGDFEVDFCNMYKGCGTGCNDVEVRMSSAKMKMNYSDRNLDGWQMFMTIRENFG